MDLKFTEVEEFNSFFCLHKHAINELQAQYIFGVLAKDLEKKNTQETLSWNLFLKDIPYSTNISNLLKYCGHEILHLVRIEDVEGIQVFFSII